MLCSSSFSSPSTDKILPLSLAQKLHQLKFKSLLSDSQPHIHASGHTTSLAPYFSPRLSSGWGQLCPALEPIIGFPYPNLRWNLTLNLLPKAILLSFESSLSPSMTSIKRNSSINRSSFQNCDDWAQVCDSVVDVYVLSICKTLHSGPRIKILKVMIFLSGVWWCLEMLGVLGTGNGIHEMP